MPDRPVFLPEARQDIADAYLWYEEKAVGLGLEFLRCLETAVLLIERQPMLYPIVHENYHRALVRRFPYAIFFEYDAEQIVIHAVFHCSQNPRKWHGRILMKRYSKG